MAYHIPVLAKESIDGLNVKVNGMYVDATYGGGGHSRLILERLQEGKILAFDQDNDAGRNLTDDQRLIFVNENFRYLKNFAKLYGFFPADGILADLGISSWQIDTAERGFSTRFDGPLDMRMNKNGERNAAWVVNNYDHAELTDIFKLYGELRNARRIADEIIFHRNNQSFETTEGLKATLLKLAPRGKENKFFAQIFQALRIEVNNELDVLKDLLIQSNDVLKVGGRLVVISYHSLEDRLVKNYMRSGNFKGEAEKDFFGNVLSPFKPVGKLIIPTQDEQDENPRSRSAKLRIAEKIA